MIAYEGVSVYLCVLMTHLRILLPKMVVFVSMSEDMVLSLDIKELTHQTAVQAQRVGSLNQARRSKVNQTTVSTAPSKGASVAMLVGGYQCSPVALPTEVGLVKSTESN